MFVLSFYLPERFVMSRLNLALKSLSVRPLVVKNTIRAISLKIISKEIIMRKTANVLVFFVCFFFSKTHMIIHDLCVSNFIVVSVCMWHTLQQGLNHT